MAENELSQSETEAQGETPLERVARAIFDEACRQSPVPPVGFADADDGKTVLQGAYDLTAIARAVLEALQDQGEAMASEEVSALALERGLKLTRFDLSDAWSVMIDAALEEG